MSNPEIIGGSAAGGGILGAILTWLGIKGRLDRLENKIDEKQSIVQCDKNHIEFKEIFKEFKGDIHKKFDTIQTDLKLLDRKLDILSLKKDDN